MANSGADIISTVPYFCGDKDCTVGVHMQYYWMEWNGRRTRYTVCDSDGDHTPITRKDVPSAAEETRLWREYTEQVARTGEDPLGNHYSPSSRGRQEAWQARLRLGILGVCAIARRGGRGPWLTGQQIPKHVQGYLCADPASRGTCILDRTEFPTLASVVEKATDCKVTKRSGVVYLRFHVKGPDVPASLEMIKAAARKHLREAK